MIRLAPFAPFAPFALFALAACNSIIELHDDDPDIDGSQIVFDAAIDSAIPGDGCAVELPCPVPTASNTTFCGRLWDTETDQPIAPALGATGASCAPNNPGASGPCTLRVRAFDALDFAQNPVAATPLTPVVSILDDCGRFRMTDLPFTTFGFTGLVADDAAGAPDVHILTAVATSDSLARPANNFRVYVTRRTTEQTWTTGAGLTGQGFAARGVLLSVFLHNGVPVAGVQLRRSGTDVVPAETFGFSDVGITRSMVSAPQELTGANGSVLSLNSPQPVAHDGTGGLPTGCQWPNTLASAIPGVVFVQRKEAESPGGGPCP